MPGFGDDLVAELEIAGDSQVLEDSLMLLTSDDQTRARR